MVSGFFTSPWDHSRILSGDARLIRMALNDSGSLGFSKKLKRSFTRSLLCRVLYPVATPKEGAATTGEDRNRNLGANLGGNFTGHLLHRRRVILRWRARVLDELH